MTEVRSPFARLASLARTVRGRAAVLAMVVVATALAVALATVLFAYRGQLRSSLDQTLEQQVADRARLLDEGSSPDSLVTVLQEEALVWIGTPDGEMIALGGAIIPLENPVPETIGGAATITVLVEEVKPDEVERERMELHVATAQTSDGTTVVLAGSESEVIDQTVGQLAKLFVIALPLLTLLVGATTWIIAGRVLGPVERMRLQAADITGSNLHARVPVPETGDEVHDLGVTLNSMLDRLESHDQSLRQFSADASHELKSPVANLRALIDTTELTDDSWDDLQGQMRGETDRLRDLVDNLLFLASHQEGQARPQQLVAIDDLLFDEAELLAATNRVAVDLGGVTPVAVQGSSADLARLVRNLVDNAARHAESRVSLSTEQSNGHVTLRVADDGPGISPADRARVFERFTRLDAARARNDGGSGLGLAIVDQIATDHNATVTIEDADSGGALFEVRFPT